MLHTGIFRGGHTAHMGLLFYDLFESLFLWHGFRAARPLGLLSSLYTALKRILFPYKMWLYPFKFRDNILLQVRVGRGVISKFLAGQESCRFWKCKTLI